MSPKENEMMIGGKPKLEEVVGQGLKDQSPLPMVKLCSRMLILVVSP